MAEGTRLLSGRRSKADRGFESRPLRKVVTNVRPDVDREPASDEHPRFWFQRQSGDRLAHVAGRSLLHAAKRRGAARIRSTLTPAIASHVMPLSRHLRKLACTVVAVSEAAE